MGWILFIITLWILLGVVVLIGHATRLGTSTPFSFVERVLILPVGLIVCIVNFITK